MEAEPLPRSERPHPATAAMDRLGPTELAALFHRVDEEVFTALGEDELVASFVALAARLRERAPTRLVLAGAGTSGRLAQLLADAWREPLDATTELRPWIAGGPDALLRSVEGAEDDTARARAELAALLADEGSFFFGISCGLSAPSVAAGLAAARELGRPAAILGTNALELARTTPFPGLERGFAGELAVLAARGDFWTLLPEVGPEPLAGSSRMKGGTATWILADALLACCDAQAARPRELLAERVAAARATRLDPSVAADAIALAAQSLRAQGRVFYVGEAGSAQAALLDASECRPTFGVEEDRVQAWMLEAWRSAPPTLAHEDCVLRLGGAAAETGPAQALDLPRADFLATKLCLNAVSTGAFTRAGKVWGNRMVDLLIANSKLFDRALRIVAELAAVSLERARVSVIAALHERDEPAAELALPVAGHIARARPGVVPLALLHARGHSLAEAATILAAEPLPRVAIEKA